VTSSRLSFIFHTTYLLYIFLNFLSLLSTIYLTRMTIGINNEMDRFSERNICFAYALLNPTVHQIMMRRWEMIGLKKDPWFKFYSWLQRGSYRAVIYKMWEVRLTMIIFQQVWENIRRLLSVCSTCATPFSLSLITLIRMSVIKW